MARLGRVSFYGTLGDGAEQVGIGYVKGVLSDVGIVLVKLGYVG